MTSNFTQALDITLKNEGGISNDKSDPGGYTKYGISLRFLQENDISIDGHGIVSEKDVQDLTEEEAIIIYKSQFWDKLKIGSINNQNLADKVFDLSVNMGGQESIKLLQRAINFQLKIQIQVDGAIGPITLTALNNVNITTLMMNYKKLAGDFYQSLVTKNPCLYKFLIGWLKRVNQ